MDLPGPQDAAGDGTSKYLLPLPDRALPSGVPGAVADIFPGCLWPHQGGGRGCARGGAGGGAGDGDGHLSPAAACHRRAGRDPDRDGYGARAGAQSAHKGPHEGRRVHWGNRELLGQRAGQLPDELPGGDVPVAGGAEQIRDVDRRQPGGQRPGRRHSAPAGDASLAAEPGGAVPDAACGQGNATLGEAHAYGVHSRGEGGGAGHVGRGRGL
mmetsp:Transcript_25618/g.71774  ORF Transcript_25618/g.71774 Transcript_25618/m.71774 type:complete len:212 (+) Transcript_25618:339-974(+)